MRDLQALVLFAVVSSGTPGPNNLLLWASGLQFGFRATVPQIVGTSAGIGALALAVAAGLGVTVTRFPEVELALKLLGFLVPPLPRVPTRGRRRHTAGPDRAAPSLPRGGCLSVPQPEGMAVRTCRCQYVSAGRRPGRDRQRARDPHDDGRRHPDRGSLGRRRDRATPARSRSTVTPRPERRARAPARRKHRLHLDLNLGDGARRDRTADLLIANQALSQLSYSPELGHILAGGPRRCSELPFANPALHVLRLLAVPRAVLELDRRDRAAGRSRRPCARACPS